MTGTMFKNLFFAIAKKIESGAFQSIFCACIFGRLQQGEKKLDKDTEVKLLLDVGK